MKILFLDQSGKPGGAELCLLDIAKFCHDCQVGLFEDGYFRELLEQQKISVQVLANQPIQVRKDSSWLKGPSSIKQLAPLVAKTVQLARKHDIIYANTPKALVVGAIASFLSHRPLVYHLHDILSIDHFSASNRRLIVALANQFATAVIANSKATRAAFVQAGGRDSIATVIYNGFAPERYENNAVDKVQFRRELNLGETFLIGHFSRLSPWKGQHLLLEALPNCPPSATAIFVGDALFGEQEYVEFLRDRVIQLGLKQRVRFLGFQQDVVSLMHTCDVVVHTSTSPEPFGRVIVEAMLCGCPVIAAQAGGAVELVEPDQTGWLVPAGDPLQLAAAITDCYKHPQIAAAFARQAQQTAIDRFHIDVVNQQISAILEAVVQARSLC